MPDGDAWRSRKGDAQEQYTGHRRGRRCFHSRPTMNAGRDTNTSLKIQEVHLFVDDTGSRRPDNVSSEIRRVGMDCFGLGGVLLDKEVEGTVRSAMRAF